MLDLSSLSKTLKWEGMPLVSGYSKGIALVFRPFSEYEINIIISDDVF